MKAEELFSIKLDGPDAEVKRMSRKRWDLLAKPIEGLGDFEEMVSRIASIQVKLLPDISRKALIIMCADNGVFEEGVSQTVQSVTRDVAALMGEGKSSVGMMLKGMPVDSFVYDVGINSEDTPEGVIDARIRRGTGNIAKEPAMTESECLRALQTGMDAVEKCRKDGYGIVATGEMGIGNTTTTTAILCALMGLKPEDITGKGAGLSEEGLQRKIRAVRSGLERFRGAESGCGVTGNSSREALQVLINLGGLDIAGLTGVFIGGALCHIPIVIDGFISACSALLAERLVPGCRNFMIASHLGREAGMEMILRELDLKPVIHAGLALGEGTGAVLLFPMLDMVMSLYENGMSFADARIDQYERFK